MAQQHKSRHVLLFPFPLQGHMNPLIQFAKRLNSKSVKTTLITTIYTSNSILANNTSSTSINILAVSDGFDEGGYASAESAELYLDTFRKVGSISLLNQLKKLQSQGEKIDAVIYDAFIPWVMDVVIEAGIKGGAFFTQACAVNNIYYHVSKGYISLPLSSSSVTVPGLPTLENWETPSFVHNYGPYPEWSKTVFNQFVNIDKATWVFTNTFYELEQQVIEWMKKMWNLKVIGPTLPSMYLDKQIEDDTDYGINLIKANDIEVMKWLNNKPKESVVYVAFGSMAQLGPEQMEEVALGLVDSGTNFLWIVRGDEKEKLPKGFLDTKSEKRLIVGWCKQLEVLAHESVGCFLTHCGFNSTLEAISLGVPVVAMPQWTDQITNAKCIEDIWGVGIRVKADEKGIVRRENLVSCIKEIMKGERGLVARKNAIKWKELAKKSFDQGGKSDKDIDTFVSELVN